MKSDFPQTLNVVLWWGYRLFGDKLMLATLYWWQFSDVAAEKRKLMTFVEMLVVTKSVTDIIKRKNTLLVLTSLSLWHDSSPTSKSFHQLISSPTSVINIDLAASAESQHSYFWHSFNEFFWSFKFLMKTIQSHLKKNVWSPQRLVIYLWIEPLLTKKINLKF